MVRIFQDLCECFAPKLTYRFRKVANKLAVRVGSQFSSKANGREEFFNKYERLFEDIFGESNRRVESLRSVDLGRYGYVGTTAKTTMVD